MKRVVTALFLVPLAVYCALFAPWPIFFGVVAIVSVLCFHEYATITRSFAPLGYIVGLLMLIAPPRETVLIMLLGALAAMCVPLAAPDVETATARSAALALGFIYIFGSWKTVVLLHDSAPARAAFGVPAGRHWLMFGLMVNWIGDTGAYYVGRAFGRHQLAPEVSPGKTWEGAVGSVVAAVIFGLIYVPFAIGGTPLVLGALLALAANAAGQVGDLAESAIKRGVRVKDSGTLLPGHGGFLDRLDSTMFSLPVLYAILSALP